MIALCGCCVQNCCLLRINEIQPCVSQTWASEKGNKLKKSPCYLPSSTAFRTVLAKPQNVPDWFPCVAPSDALAQDSAKVARQQNRRCILHCQIITASRNVCSRSCTKSLAGILKQGLYESPLAQPVSHAGWPAGDHLPAPAAGGAVGCQLMPRRS